jgi:predicted DNA-binding protein
MSTKSSKPHFVGIHLPTEIKSRVDALCSRAGLKKGAFYASAIESAVSNAEQNGIRVRPQQLEASK